MGAAIMREEKNLLSKEKVSNTLKGRFYEYFQKLYVTGLSKQIALEIKRATGTHVSDSTIHKWLIGQNSPSPENRLILDLVYPDLRDFEMQPFVDARRRQRERELEQIIQNATRELAEIRTI